MLKGLSMNEPVMEDLLTVANAAFAIRCDDAAYDGDARESAWDLRCLAACESAVTPA